MHMGEGERGSSGRKGTAIDLEHVCPPRVLVAVSETFPGALLFRDRESTRDVQAMADKPGYRPDFLKRSPRTRQYGELQGWNRSMGA